jgi:hypothetical protein
MGIEAAAIGIFGAGVNLRERLVRGISKRAWKMDCYVWQKTHGLYFLRPWR